MAETKYFKLDSEKGYVENKHEINYCKLNQMRRVVFNRMLGDFDENGIYIINKKIVDELISLPKVIVNTIEDADLIRSKLKIDGFFHFILSIEDNKATFSLLEKINFESNLTLNSGSYNNINEYILDQVKIPDKDFNRNALYEKYNISVVDDGNTWDLKDLTEEEIAKIFNIVHKLKINYLTQTEIMLKENEIEQIEADYFEDMLDAISCVPEWGAKITKDVQSILAEKHKFILSTNPFFQKTVNEILDSVLIKYLHELSPEQLQDFEKKTAFIKEDYYREMKKILPVEVVKSAGVRFSVNNVVEERVLGSLTKTEQRKGYVESGTTRYAINEQELQLSIAKIREEKLAHELNLMRHNASAKDLTKTRKLMDAFYKQMHDTLGVDILSPNGASIKETIKTNNAEIKQDKVESNSTTATNTPPVAKATASSAGKVAGATAGAKVGPAKKPASKPAPKPASKPAAKKPTVAKKAETVKAEPTKTETSPYLSTTPIFMGKSASQEQPQTNKNIEPVKAKGENTEFSVRNRSSVRLGGGEAGGRHRDITEYTP